MKDLGMTKAEWLKKRRNYLGGSDAAPSVGQSPYVSPYQLYQDKIGALPDQQTEAMARGLALEPLVMRLYERRFDRELQAGPWVVSKDHDFMAATPDAIDDEISADVQGKTANIFTRHKYGEDGSSFVPVDYYLQCQHEMAVLGADRAQLVVLFADSDIFRALVHMLKVGVEIDKVAEFVESQQTQEKASTQFCAFPLARDQETIDMLIEGESRFWNHHVLNKIPPADTLAPEKKSDIIEADTAQRDHLQAMRIAHEAVKQAEQEYSETKSLVMVDIGENAGIYDPDIGKVTNKAGPERSKLKIDDVLAHFEQEHGVEYARAEDMARVIVDESRLLAELKILFPDEYKDAIERFTIKTRSARTVRPYWKKEKKTKPKGKK